jgi:hypothetical protein
MPAAHRGTQALVSVAMLKANLDLEGRDYIDQLNQFVRAALASQQGAIDVHALAQRMTEDFGLKIPEPVVEAALRRLRKQNVIEKVSHTYTVTSVILNDAFDARRERARRDIQRVVTAFGMFCQAEFARTVTEEDCVSAIVEFVSRFSIECLRSHVQRTPLPRLQHDDQLSYAFARFVNSAQETDVNLFDVIEVVFKGVMLANAFTCPDLDSIKKKFNKVTFYLDTSLVLSAIGVHGQAEQRKIGELLGLLGKLEGSTCVFRHTVAEIDGVLAWCESNLGKAKYRNRVLEHLTRTGATRSDITLLRGSLEEKIRDVNLGIVDTPAYVNDYQIDESVLEGLLYEEVEHLRARAAQHDINSVRSIYALRTGTAPRRLEEARAVFVTGNQAYARAVDDYSRKFEIAREVSPVITDFSLANVAWLKAPVASVNLPKYELLALCYAGLEPSDKLWQRFLHAAEKLRSAGRITADDLAVLRSDGRARQDFMDLTVGRDEEFDTSNLETVIERVHARLTLEKDAALSEKDKALATHRSALEESRAENERIQRVMLERANEEQRDVERLVGLAIVAVWSIGLIAGPALAFMTKADGTVFWLCWAVAGGVGIVPVVQYAFGWPSLRASASYFGKRARHSWIKRNAPFLLE